jgi:hypothetical protein
MLLEDNEGVQFRVTETGGQSSLICLMRRGGLIREVDANHESYVSDASLVALANQYGVRTKPGRRLFGEQ